MRNDLRRFNLVYTLRYRVMLQARCLKKFPVIFTGKSPESGCARHKKKSVTKLSGPPEPETLGKLFLAHTLYYVMRTNTE